MAQARPPQAQHESCRSFLKELVKLVVISKRMAQTRESIKIVAWSSQTLIPACFVMFRYHGQSLCAKVIGVFKYMQIRPYQSAGKQFSMSHVDCRRSRRNKRLRASCQVVHSCTCPCNVLPVCHNRVQHSCTTEGVFSESVSFTPSEIPLTEGKRQDRISMQVLRPPPTCYSE